MMKVTLWIDPPRTTHQQKKVRIQGGFPRFYEPKHLKDARLLMMNELAKYKPLKPMSGAIELRVNWYFSTKSHKDNEWKLTKPDLDNMVKLLNDCLTDCGYWDDDALVVKETLTKRWVKKEKPRIEIEIEEIA